jgi:DNA-binding GntR family transcriptional regulator
MAPLARNNLSDQIFDIISRKIVRNELAPGELIYETHISKELGVSRSPVRDAMHMLERIWLVERTPKGSYRVTFLSVELIRSLYDAAIILYQYAFARAAERASQKDLARLKKAMREIEKSIENNDVDQYLGNVSAMARIILAVAGNPMVERVALELMPTAERIQWASITYLPDQLKKVITHLRKGYESIENRDPEKAAKAFEDFAATHVQVVIDSLNVQDGKAVQNR